MFDHTLATDFAKSALSLVETGEKSLRERAALALAALASAGEQSLEAVVAHHQVDAYTHRNPDGTKVVVKRNPWAIVEAGVHFNGPVHLKKWKEIRAGSWIGRDVRFGDWASVGEGAVIGDGTELREHTIVPDGFWVFPPFEKAGPSGLLAGMASSLRRLVGAAPAASPPEVRVQCALDLVELVCEDLHEQMSDDEIVDAAYRAVNAYFLKNTGFVIRPVDADDYTVFSKKLVRHVNPDGSTAVVTASAFGGLGPDVTVDGHAFIGDWAWINGRSSISRGASTPSHMDGVDVVVECLIDRRVDTDDLQALLRLLFLTSVDRGYGIEISPEEAEIAEWLQVTAPEVDDSDWEWGDEGPVRPARTLPFSVSRASVTDVKGSSVDVSLRSSYDEFGDNFPRDADEAYAAPRP